MKVKTIAVIPLVVATALSTLVAQQPREAQQGPQSFRFRTGVELINVNATVTDSTGRFVSGLNKEDFRLFEDEQLQEITHFNSERVPVSLGIVLDTSGSMDGEKMLAAREALDRFLLELLGPEDEVFLYRFDSNAELVQGWTKDHARVRSELGRLFPRGGTAMYDAVSEAIPLAQSGRHKKKALLVISDGNDTSSEVSIRDLKQQIRESEVLVYAVGIDGNARPTRSQATPPSPRPRTPTPFPFPFPPRRAPIFPGQPRPQIFGGRPSISDDRVNVAALRDMTDDSGGRTESVRDPGDLDSATAGISDELSKQYYLGYSSAGKKDGRWHTIRVEIRRSNYRVRARTGYLAN
jgi:Ca-activated chloride channel family protein